MADPTYAREQARKIGYEADIRRLELEEKLGKLVPVADVERATIACAEVLLRTIDQGAMQAEEVHAAAAGGIASTRTALKALLRGIRARCAAEFTKLPAAVGAVSS